MFNSVTLVGVVLLDPVVQYYDSGSVRAELTMSVSRNGDSYTVDLELWGKEAQRASDYAKRTTMIGIIGSFVGTKDARTKIRVDRLEILSKGENS